MLSLKEILEQEHNLEHGFTAFDAKASLMCGFCIVCGFYNRRPFKPKSEMTENELLMLDVFENENGKRQPYVPVMPKKLNGYWATICLPCFQDNAFKFACK